MLPEFSHSQHHPVVLEIGIQIPTVVSTLKPKWNFAKAKWPEYSKELDAKNYNYFVGLVLSIAKKHVPRRFWMKQSHRLCDKCVDSGDTEIKRKQLKAGIPITSEYSRDFSLDKINQELGQTKMGKAAGFDGAYPEFLLNSGKKGDNA